MQIRLNKGEKTSLSTTQSRPPPPPKKERAFDPLRALKQTQESNHLRRKKKAERFSFQRVRWGRDHPKNAVSSWSGSTLHKPKPHAIRRGNRQKSGAKLKEKPIYRQTVPKKISSDSSTEEPEQAAENRKTAPYSPRRLIINVLKPENSKINEKA